MKIVLAKNSDLEIIKTISKDVINLMDKQGIEIWNEYYPSECFCADIEKENLYLLKNDIGEIVALGVLCDEDESGDAFLWSGTKNSKFLTRFMVNINYLSQGYGKLLLKEMIDIAKNKGVKTLKLSVAKVNIPAISLYKKFGFKKVEGSFFNNFITRCDNEEYGYELILKKDTI